MFFAEIYLWSVKIEIYCSIISSICTTTTENNSLLFSSEQSTRICNFGKIVTCKGAEFRNLKYPSKSSHYAEWLITHRWITAAPGVPEVRNSPGPESLYEVSVNIWPQLTINNNKWPDEMEHGHQIMENKGTASFYSHFLISFTLGVLYRKGRGHFTCLCQWATISHNPLIGLLLLIKTTILSGTPPLLLYIKIKQSFF